MEYETAKGAEIELRPADAMKLLYALDEAGDKAGEAMQLARADETEDKTIYRIWLAGNETVHQLHINGDGTWKMTSFLPV